MTSYFGTLFDAAFFVPSIGAFKFSGLANISCQGYFILYRVSGIRVPFFHFFFFIFKVRFRMSIKCLSHRLERVLFKTTNSRSSNES